MLTSWIGDVVFTVLLGMTVLGIILFVYSFYRDVAGLFSDKDVR